MSILFKGMEMPTSCVKCEWRDAEVGGDCELMICNPFESYEEQYKHCPFQEISKRYSIVHVPPHGDLIDRDPFIEFIKTHWDSYDQWFVEHLEARPTIIPAEEGE